MNISIGDKVWWEDPDEGLCSGLFTVINTQNPLSEDQVYSLLSKDEVSQTEAFEHELTPLQDDWHCPYCGNDCYNGDGCDEFNAGGFDEIPAHHINYTVHQSGGKANPDKVYDLHGGDAQRLKDQIKLITGIDAVPGLFESLGITVNSVDDPSLVEDTLLGMLLSVSRMILEDGIDFLSLNREEWSELVSKYVKIHARKAEQFVSQYFEDECFADEVHENVYKELCK